ncbi:efflux RND transporter permease subunit [Marivirga lumbricoides]|uniref:efflux RND transporter permease subunit n=1 Tax=Marivirga lumbricoides TaxID=1046115 RepID=UPI00166591A5
MSSFRSIIAFIVISILGISLIPELSVNLNPVKVDNTLQISYSIADASPQEVERLASAPIENVMSQLRDLDKISSVSRYNGGNVSLEFSRNTDMGYKRFEVAALLRQLYPQLAKRVSYPFISPLQDQNQQQDLLRYTLSAPLAAFKIEEVLKESILKKIQSTEGVKATPIYGATPLQVGIYYSSTKLSSYSFTPADLKRALSNAGGLRYPGLAKMNSQQFLSILLDGRFKNIQQLGEMYVTNSEGRSMRLKNLAEIIPEEQTPQSYYRINAKNFVTLAIEAREGVNRLQLARLLKSEINSATELLPSGYELRLVSDDTEFIEKELDKLYQRSLLSILILIGFIFLINRDWRYLLVLFSGIVVNCCLAIIGIWLFDIQIHIYSLAGLTISFGLIVDNAIVMIDHIHKYKNKHLFLALFAASLTTIAALLLVFLLPEDQKNNLIDFTKIVAVLLGVSLLVALFFTPALYQLLFEQKAAGSKKQSYKGLRRRVKLFRIYYLFIAWNAHYRKWWFIAFLLAFGLPVFLLPSKWEGQEWYNNTIGSDLYQEDIRPISDKLLGGSLRLFVRNVYERSSYREKEKTRLYVNAQLPYGNTLEQMNVIIKDFESYLLAQKGIQTFTTNIRSGQFASIEIVFEEAYELGGLPYQLKARLSARSTNWSGVKWNIYGVGQGFSTGSSDQIPSFRVEMKGYNYFDLEREAKKLAAMLLEHPRIQEVNTNERLSWNDKKSEEYVLVPDVALLAKKGISLSDFADGIRSAARAGSFNNYFEIGGQWWPVKVQETTAGRFDKYTLDNNSIMYSEKRIPVAEVSELFLESTSNAIYKEDRNYIRSVSFEYYGSGRFGDKYLKEVLAKYDKMKPLGYSAAKKTFSWGFNEAKKQYGLLLILIVAIFFICCILFESFRLPFFILILIPIAFIGLFLTFGWFEFYFDQGGYAAFIMLGGLTVNAGIYILYDFQHRKSQNNRNFMKAVSYKSMPILLTIFSTCFGLVPFVLGGQNEVFWFSLAVGTIGGLIVSLLGVFFLLPLMAFKIKK